AGRRHIVVQRGDDRGDERLEIDVRSDLPGEGLDDSMLDGMPYAGKIEHVFDLSFRSEVFGRMRAGTSTTCECFQSTHDRVASFALVVAGALRLPPATLHIAHETRFRWHTSPPSR